MHSWKVWYLNYIWYIYIYIYDCSFLSITDHDDDGPINWGSFRLKMGRPTLEGSAGIFRFEDSDRRQLWWSPTLNAPNMWKQTASITIDSWYVYHSQSWVVHGIVIPTLFIWLVVTGIWILFSHIFGIIIPTDVHIFQRIWNHQSVMVGFERIGGNTMFQLWNWSCLSVVCSLKPCCWKRVAG